MFFNMMRSAFSDFRVNVEDMVAEGDKVVVRSTMTGRHTGEFLGMPPTNRQISVPVIDVLVVRDGKATEHWGVTDTGAMMMQLGGAQAPAG